MGPVAINPDAFKKKSRDAQGPAFSTIDSLAKAEELLRQGALEKLFLLPMEFGGEDRPQNVVFVPVELGAVKSRIDRNIIGRLISEGKVSEDSAVPQSVGDSFIPTSIEVKAWDPGQFTTTIQVWGDQSRAD